VDGKITKLDVLIAGRLVKVVVLLNAFKLRYNLRPPPVKSTLRRSVAFRMEPTAGI
jgi:hypothetical protein